MSSSILPIELLFRDVSLVHNLLRKIAEDVLHSSGLTVAEWNALRLIDGRKNITSRDLKTLLFTAAASVATLVQGLESKGMITRVQSADDKRVQYLHITASAQKKIQSVVSILRKHPALTQCNKQELEHADELLQSIITSLTSSHTSS